MRDYSKCPLQTEKIVWGFPLNGVKRTNCVQLEQLMYQECEVIFYVPTTMLTKWRKLFPRTDIVVRSPTGESYVVNSVDFHLVWRYNRELQVVQYKNLDYWDCDTCGGTGEVGNDQLNETTFCPDCDNDNH
jgi:hypothetical protein